MAQVLELWDEQEEPATRTGASATLLPDGRVTYTGVGIQAILSRRLVDQDAEKVFNDLDGWSNGYLSLRLKDSN